MTFYNIIFGILFLGACRELFQAAFHKRWRDTCIAATVALLVFNDTLFTSHEIESLRLTYTVRMKLIDLTDFLLLIAAIVVLSPERNFLGITVRRRLFKRRREPIIWFLLSLYWALSLQWNLLGHVYSEAAGYKQWLATLLLVPFVAMAGMSFSPSAALTKYSRWLVILIVLAYILIKAYAYH